MEYLVPSDMPPAMSLYAKKEAELGGTVFHGYYWNLALT
jgi:hypothetical protein